MDLPNKIEITSLDTRSTIRCMIVVNKPNIPATLVGDKKYVPRFYPLTGLKIIFSPPSKARQRGSIFAKLTRETIISTSRHMLGEWIKQWEGIKVILFTWRKCPLTYGATQKI